MEHVCNYPRVPSRHYVRPRGKSKTSRQKCKTSGIGTCDLAPVLQTSEFINCTQDQIAQWLEHLGISPVVLGSIPSLVTFICHHNFNRLWAPKRQSCGTLMAYISVRLGECVRSEQSDTSLMEHVCNYPRVPSRHYVRPRGKSKTSRQKCKTSGIGTCDLAPVLQTSEFINCTQDQIAQWLEHLGISPVVLGSIPSLVTFICHHNFNTHAI
ncbi:hypothetical protein DFH05DRAFT_828237 [Lentinula detonsa]|uniref:Uncharacterized protein n=1 Tax=Lentinula detonsa TaxID=2804962 RepID=A0A9W8U0B0_9AGAR|nr:hypothetical protein DFH05DRAFT_828237 [Lentinula detonsa]